MPVQKDLLTIRLAAAENEAENDAFRIFLKQQDKEWIDSIVHRLNDEVTPQIDCTQCGNCCRSLIIGVTGEETVPVANHLQISVASFKQKYIEESEQGEMVMNTIPCHFLNGTICAVYEHRFEPCRDFPHLHKPNFTSRLFGTLMYYEICPIIFNVVEKLKVESGFNISGHNNILAGS
ncbi:MAG: YkgJ family cysteine cluster protein [Ferruginibacter sp.]